MNYVFVKQFNPAYDRFLMAYFKEHGLRVDENTTFKELDNRVSRLNREKMSDEELLLTYYARNWGMHPECRPSLYRLLDKTFGGSGRPDPDKMRQLESKLPPGKGKLLFTKEEVAADVSGFYKKYMRNPLKSDIQKEATDNRLAAYLSSKDFAASAVTQPPHKKSRERDVYQIAVELLVWLEGINLEKVARDVDKIIAEHESNSEHMRESTGIVVGRTERMKVCQHESEYLRLQVYEDLDGAVTAFLSPSRGFLISDTVFEEGWNDVVFPKYYVVRAMTASKNLDERSRKTPFKRELGA